MHEIAMFFHAMCYVFYCFIVALRNIEIIQIMQSSILNDCKMRVAICIILLCFYYATCYVQYIPFAFGYLCDRSMLICGTLHNVSDFLRLSTRKPLAAFDNAIITLISELNVLALVVKAVCPKIRCCF